MSPERVSQFTDAIFAFSATLLILNFAVPVVANQNNAALTIGLISQWPKLLAFLLSFGAIVNYWRQHGAIFRGVQVVDHTTILLNTTMLAVSVFVPYVTNVVGTYPLLPAAAVLYAATLLLLSFVGKLTGEHLIRVNAHKGNLGPTARLAFQKRSALAVYVRAVGLLFAFFVPVVSYVLYWLVVIYFLAARGIDEYSAQEAE